MIDGLKPYPKMKDSGVPWLGEVPEHWDVRRGKWLFRCRKDLNSDLRNKNILSLTLRGVVNNDPDNPEGLVPKDYGTYQVFEKDDLVFKLIDLENIRTSRVGLVHEDGIMSPAYVRLVQTHSGDQRFYFQQYFDLYQRGIFNQLGAGVRSTLSAHDLLEVPVLSPTVDEQAAIVRFLDHADRRIRRYIRAKQKLIKLLEEQKQAIIHRAVTRGLDPNVRLKPSGVEWLGDVPEHWEVIPLKFLSERIQNGATPSTSEIAFYDNGVVPWYGPSSCAQGEYVGAPVRHLAQTAFTAGRARLIHGPALLVVVIGATAGRMALLPHDGATNQQITSYVLRTKRVCPRFVLLQVRGAERWLRSTASTATIPILDGGVVSRLSVAIPSVTDQESILRRADEDTVDLAAAIDRAHHEIALLREYRTRLIADVVTGKLDVREAAARLPDEVEEPEPLDEIEAEGDPDEAGADDTDAVPEESEA